MPRPIALASLLAALSLLACTPTATPEVAGGWSGTFALSAIEEAPGSVVASVVVAGSPVASTVPVETATPDGGVAPSVPAIPAPSATATYYIRPGGGRGGGSGPVPTPTPTPTATPTPAPGVDFEPVDGGFADPAAPEAAAAR